MTLHEEQKKVQKAMESTLSGLQEDPWLKQRILANTKGEEPVKKKLSVSALVIALMLIVSVVAFAATNWTGITEFLGGIVGGWNVNEEAIAATTIKEKTSKWINLTATEAYWAEDGLSVILKVDSADDSHVVCYQFEEGLTNEEGEMSDQIKIGEEMVSIEKWRAGKELIICEFAPVGEGWTWYKRSDEGLFVIITSGDPDAEALQKGTDLTFEVHCCNIQTGEKETSTVTVTLPAMTMQEGHK